VTIESSEITEADPVSVAPPSGVSSRMKNPIPDFELRGFIG
jgi:hypothetical protein